MSVTEVAETEGTIQFAFSLEAPIAPVIDNERLKSLAAWRTIFRRLGLAGQNPKRYLGFGFGNFSTRTGATTQSPDAGAAVDHSGQFVITASQTSGQVAISDADLVRVDACNLERFWVEATGHLAPSSETLTHAMIYAADPRIQWVYHVHSPEIWRHSEHLGLPATSIKVPYGSKLMVDAVAKLLATHHSRPLVFSTLGHEDGVFVCGQTAADTGSMLVGLLAKAIVASQQVPPKKRAAGLKTATKSESEAPSS